MEMTTSDPPLYGLELTSTDQDGMTMIDARGAEFFNASGFSRMDGQARYGVHISSLMLEWFRFAILPTLFAFLSCLLWNHYNNTSRDPECKKPLPPGGFGLPLIGETLTFLFWGKDFLDRRRARYGSVYKTHILGFPTVRVIGPENVKRILRGENSLVTTRWPTSTAILLGEGSISHASGESHMTKKKAVMRAFSYSALSGYVPTIQTVVRSYIGRWCGQSRVLGYPAFKTLYFDLSCRVLFGFVMSQSECTYLMEVFKTFTSNLFCVPLNIPGSGFRKAIKSRDILLQKIEDNIRALECKTSLGNYGNDALSQIIKLADKDKLSMDELKNLCLELLFAGHGTTSSAAAFLVLQLSKHPDVVEKIRMELEANEVGEPGSAFDLDFQTINKLTYVKNVVREVLRLSPPVGAGFRKALKTFEIDGYQVPAGWTVTYAIRDTHEEIIAAQNSGTFDPDRWNDSAFSETDFRYLPFGGGRRSCAGKQLAQLMLKIFTVEMVRGCNWTMEKTDAKFQAFPLPYPVDDLPLRFTAVAHDFRNRARTV